MELELGLSLPNHNNPMMSNGLHSSSTTNDAIQVETNLSSMLLWNPRQPDRSNAGGCRLKPRRLQMNHDDIHEENQEREGWRPPIDSWRSKSHHRDHGGPTAAEQTRNSMYVKVKMEGVAIGRKIDLTKYDSYQDLTNTLINMFTKYSKTEKYVLVYQNNEGDWMLVGDVQWERFVECAQRLEIRKDNKMEFQLLSTLKDT